MVSIETILLGAIVGGVFIIGRNLERINLHVRQLDERHELHLIAQGFDDQKLKDNLRLMMELRRESGG